MLASLGTGSIGNDGKTEKRQSTCKTESHWREVSTGLSHRVAREVRSPNEFSTPKPVALHQDSLRATGER